MDINIERRTVEFNDVYVRRSQVIAKVDDVLNTLTVLMCSEKPSIEITNPSVASYLVENQLVSESSPGQYAMTDEVGCAMLSDTLSDYMEGLLSSYCQ